MDNTIIVAVLSALGTLLGSIGGILATARMTSYRLSKLEEKVDKHNNVVERMARVEQSTSSAHHRLDGLQGLITKRG